MEGEWVSMCLRRSIGEYSSVWVVTICQLVVSTDEPSNEMSIDLYPINLSVVENLSIWRKVIKIHSLYSLMDEQYGPSMER